MSEDYNSFTGTCPTCNQTYLRKENQKMRECLEFILITSGPVFEKAAKALIEQCLEEIDAST